jgi:hypothetical protein
MPFTLFGPCIAGAQGMDEASAPAAIIATDGRQVRISAADGLPLGDLVILDAMGRMVRTIRAGDTTVTVDLSGDPAGTYLLRQLDLRRPAQRFIIF